MKRSVFKAFTRQLLGFRAPMERRCLSILPGAQQWPHLHTTATADKFQFLSATTKCSAPPSTKSRSTLLLQMQHIPPIRILMAEFIHQRTPQRKAEPTDLRVFDRLRRPFGFPHRRIERIGEITDG